MSQGRPAGGHHRHRHRPGAHAVCQGAGGGRVEVEVLAPAGDGLLCGWRAVRTAANDKSEVACVTRVGPVVAGSLAARLRPGTGGPAVRGGGL